MPIQILGVLKFFTMFLYTESHYVTILLFTSPYSSVSVNSPINNGGDTSIIPK
jgi:hypothetical protein